LILWGGIWFMNSVFLGVTLCFVFYGCQKLNPLLKEKADSYSSDRSDGDNEIINNHGNGKTKNLLSKDSLPSPNFPNSDHPLIPEYIKIRYGDSEKVSLEDWENLVDSDRVENLLLNGSILWRKTKISIKEMGATDGNGKKKVIFLCKIFQGGKYVRAQLKIPQRYFNDWRYELMAYRLGRKLGFILPPTVLRRLKKVDFKRIIPPVSDEILQLIEWKKRGGLWVEGTLRYWVETLKPGVIGGRKGDEEYILKIAKSLHPLNRKELITVTPVYLEIGRMIVFDYIINNNDRPGNLGTFILPNGEEKLILFDHGLSFGKEKGSQGRSKAFFDLMEMMPQDLTEKLKNLTKEELKNILFSDIGEKMDEDESHLTEIMKRRDIVIQKAERLSLKYGNEAFY